jgi:hypothetical protein
MAQNEVTDTEQYIANRSYDPTFDVQTAEGLVYDGTVLRRVAVDANGYLKVTI